MIIKMPLIKAIQPIMAVKKAEANMGAKIANPPIRMSKMLRIIIQLVAFLTSAGRRMLVFIVLSFGAID